MHCVIQDVTEPQAWTPPQLLVTLGLYDIVVYAIIEAWVLIAIIDVPVAGGMCVLSAALQDPQLVSLSTASLAQVVRLEIWEEA